MRVRFSVVIPVYNRAKYLRQAIDSVLCQSFTEYEVIAVDDGSTDESSEILKSYGNRITVVRQPNQGPEVARNTGAALAQGEYIALLDSDDFLFPSALGIYDRIIRTFDSPPLIIGSVSELQDGQTVPPEVLAPCPIQILKFKDYLSKTVTVTSNCSAFLIRKQVYDEAGGFRNSTAQTWFGDCFDFVLRLGTYQPFIKIQTPCTVARIVHESNSIWDVTPHAGGLLGVARLERQGRYPGGNERRRDRYAYIGGVSAGWAYSYCWRRGQKKTALRLLFGTAPMVVVAVWKRFLRRFHNPPQPIVLPVQQS